MRILAAGYGIVALAVLAAPLSAQEHQHREGMHGEGMHQAEHAGMMMPGMMLRAFRPAQLLEQRADLKLSADQVTKLEQLKAAAAAKHAQAMQSHETHRHQLMEALHAAEPTASAVRSHFTGAHDAMGQAHWVELEAGLAAMALLTAEQRAMVRGKMGQGMQHREGQGCCQGNDKGMQRSKN